MIFADLHIHIGQSLDGKYVKITGAKTLTLPNILEFAREVKGLVIKPLSAGGYAAGGLTLIPGHEIELQIGEGYAHFLAYFQSLEHIQQYVKALKQTTKNWQLSTQRGFLPIDLWLEAVSKDLCPSGST